MVHLFRSGNLFRLLLIRLLRIIIVTYRNIFSRCLIWWLSMILIIHFLIRLFGELWLPLSCMLLLDCYCFWSLCLSSGRSRLRYRKYMDYWRRSVLGIGISITSILKDCRSTLRRIIPQKINSIAISHTFKMGSIIMPIGEAKPLKKHCLKKNLVMICSTWQPGVSYPRARLKWGRAERYTSK